MIRLLTHLWQNFRKEDGTASIEFVFAIPVLMVVFMASCESGYFMVRHVMLERAVDMTMRDLRLGLLGNISHDDLRTLMCSRAVVLHNCSTNLKIELTPISTATWALPTAAPTCIDRSIAIEPVTTFVRGGGSEPVIVRVCVRQNAMFPSTGVGLGLQQDAQGGYALVARSVFVNEPT
jgi:hypothetical protein